MRCLLQRVAIPVHECARERAGPRAKTPTTTMTRANQSPLGNLPTPDNARANAEVMLPIGAAAAPTIRSVPPTPEPNATAGGRGESAGTATVDGVTTAPLELFAPPPPPDAIPIANQWPTLKPSQRRLNEPRIALLATPDPTPSPPLRRRSRVHPPLPIPRHRMTKAAAIPPEHTTIDARTQTTPAGLVLGLVPSPI